jgi:CubicO group peptidase (beta-lactamase class C family)
MVLQFLFEFFPGPPHWIVGLAIEAGPPDESPKIDLPPLDLSGSPSREEIRDRLGTYFRDLYEQDLFSGAVLLAIRGHAFFSTAQGMASKRWNVPNSVNTRFDLGSINKTFTHVAIARLVAEGSLKLDDRILDHLPDYSNREAGSRITIRHLLDHSSGLGDIFNDRFFRSSKALYRNPEDFFPLFADEPLLFEPGSSSRYSNAGYMVLGAIITAASGEPYDLYVQKHIFENAGMHSTGFFARDEPVPQVAEGYTSRGGKAGQKHYLSNVFMLPVRGNSAGSAYSTVEDLLRFDTAIRERRLLPSAYTRWVLGGPEPGPDSLEVDSGRVAAGIGWAGGAPGVSAVLESDGNVALVILSNYDEPIAEAVVRTIYGPLQRALIKDSSPQ